jgi:hypothetical protein
MYTVTIRSATFERRHDTITAETVDHLKSRLEDHIKLLGFTRQIACWLRVVCLVLLFFMCWDNMSALGPFYSALITLGIYCCIVEPLSFFLWRKTTISEIKCINEELWRWGVELAKFDHPEMIREAE